MVQLVQIDRVCDELRRPLFVAAGGILPEVVACVAQNLRLLGKGEIITSGQRWNRCVVRWSRAVRRG